MGSAKIDAVVRPQTYNGKRAGGQHKTSCLYGGQFAGGSRLRIGGIELEHDPVNFRRGRRRLSAYERNSVVISRRDEASRDKGWVKF